MSDDDDQQAVTAHSAPAVERSGQHQRAVSRSVRDQRISVVRDRRSQHQSGRAEYMGQLPPDSPGERRPARVFQERPRVPGGHPEHAAGLEGSTPRRLRDLRAGLVDAESPHGELRRTLGVLRARCAGGNGTGRARFTAARTFGPIDWPTWTSLSPRGGAVYDLFGNQKTAIKFSMGKFMQAGSTGFSESYNPLALTTAAVDWTDAYLVGFPQGELGCVYQTAGCELNLAQLPNGFGAASLSNVDPDIKRMYNVETSLSVQHELRQGVSLTAGWAPIATTRTCDAATMCSRRSPTTRRTTSTARSTAHRSPSSQRERGKTVLGQLPRHQRIQRPQDVVQRVRVQLQRAPAARHQPLRRRHE